MTEPDDTYGDEALAGEYVLRVLDADIEAAVTARLSQDAALRGMVRAWEARLAALAEEIAEVPPPAALRSRLLAAVGAAPGRRGWLRRWPALASGLAAAALALLVVVGNPFGPDLTPAFQAELATESGDLVLVAAVIPATHEIVIERQVGAAPETGVLELWLIAEGAAGPVSLGLLDNDGSTRITVPDAIAPGVRSGTIAISNEPEGGSPTGAPTGPVLATATFTDL